MLARVLPILAALAVALWYQAGLLFGDPFHGYDWGIHFHYYDWIRIALREHGVLPLYMVDAWHTGNFLANAQTPLSSPFAPLLAVLDTTPYIRFLIVLYTGAALLGTWALLRDLGVRAVFAATGAILYACGGFTAAHVSVGHHWSLGIYALPWLFLLVRRAIGGSRAAFAAAALLDGLTLLEGQHHPFLWQNGFLALWAAFESLRVRTWRPLLTVAGVLGLGAAVAGLRMVPMLLEFGNYLPEERIPGIAPSELLRSLLARDQLPDLTPEEIAVIEGSGWWEYVFYVGGVGVLFWLIGSARALRECGPLLAAGAVTAVLAIDWRGSLGVDPWETLRHWPVVSSQRGPARLLLLTTFALGVAGAVGWDRLLPRPAPGSRAARAMTVAGSLLALGLLIDLTTFARPWQASALGAPLVSRPHRLQRPDLVGGPGTIRIASEGPNHVEYEVTTERDALLVLALDVRRELHQWVPEGRPVKGHRGRMAVAVAGGGDRVRLRYRPPGLWPGVALSAGAMLAVGGLLLWPRAGLGQRAPLSPRASGGAADD